jgi:hypothetical protein
VMDMSLGAGDRDVTRGLVTRMSLGACLHGNCPAIPPKHREFRFLVLPEQSSHPVGSASKDARRLPDVPQATEVSTHHEKGGVG